MMETDKEYLREKILTNELGNRMLDTVAPIYDKSALSLYVFQAFGVVLSECTDDVEDIIKQAFPQTATWGLKYWEEEHGIVTDESKTMEERRAYLISVLSKKLPITPYSVRQIVHGVTGCDSQVIENILPNTIKIIVRAYVPGMLTLLNQELNRMLPAHINYVIDLAELHEMKSSSYTGCSISVLEHYEIEEV